MGAWGAVVHYLDGVHQRLGTLPRHGANCSRPPGLLGCWVAREIFWVSVALHATRSRCVHSAVEVCARGRAVWLADPLPPPRYDARVKEHGGRGSQRLARTTLHHARVATLVLGMRVPDEGSSTRAAREKQNMQMQLAMRGAIGGSKYIICRQRRIVIGNGPSLTCPVADDNVPGPWATSDEQPSRALAEP